MLFIVFFFVFVHVTLLIPGFVAVKKSGLFSDSPPIELISGYVISLLFFALLAFSNYIFDINLLVTRFFCWAILALTFWIFIKNHYYQDLLVYKIPLVCAVLMSLLSTAFLSLTFASPYKFVPDPHNQPYRNYKVLSVKVLNIIQTQADDNYIPYRQAQFFTHRIDAGSNNFISEWGVTFFQRTPLMGAVTANYFNIFGETTPLQYTWSNTGFDPDQTYLQFQLISHVLNALFIIPAFFLLLKLFGSKTAVLSSLFLTISPFFLYNSIFSWPKSLVAFFVLSSFFLLLHGKTRYVIMAGAVSGIGYLTHDLAVLYIGTAVCLLLYQRRYRDLLIYISIPVVFLLPWLYAADIYYRKPSSFFIYPFSTHGQPQPGQNQQIINSFLHTSPLKIIWIRLVSLFYLLSPYQLLFSDATQSWAKRFWAVGYFSIPGSIGLGLMVPAYIGLVRARAKVLILSMMPVVFAVLVFGWPKGLGALHFAQASVVLLTGIAVSYMLKLKDSRWLLLPLLFGVAQLIFFMLYSYRFNIGAWYGSFSDIACLSVIAAIISAVGYEIYAVSQSKKSFIFDQNTLVRPLP
jgi:4-amino-4-deoxy-L-arabinose transferase-like glycosyltransferase